MKIRFTKMHGCGNDYIYIDGARTAFTPEEKPEIVRKLSDRHFGIGGDGVIFINPSAEADFEMEMYNMDGSRGEMCGNGIRCVAKYVYDKGLTDKERLSIISAGKIKYLELFPEEGKIDTVKVNMGAPILEAARIPVLADDGQKAVIGREIEAAGKTYSMTCVSMGNPHAVIFVEDVAGLEIEKVGPAFERHALFPQRINTEFVRVIDRKTLEMRVWERGSGETLACGTGACATVVAGVLNGLCEETAQVKLLGGTLLIHWDREEDQVYMTGPARTVFEGEIEV